MKVHAVEYFGGMRQNSVADASSQAHAATQIQAKEDSESLGLVQRAGKENSPSDFHDVSHTNAETSPPESRQEHADGVDSQKPSTMESSKSITPNQKGSVREASPKRTLMNHVRNPSRENTSAAKEAKQDSLGNTLVKSIEKSVVEESPSIRKDSKRPQSQSPVAAEGSPAPEAPVEPVEGGRRASASSERQSQREFPERGSQRQPGIADKITACYQQPKHSPEPSWDKADLQPSQGTPVLEQMPNDDTFRFIESPTDFTFSEHKPYITKRNSFGVDDHELRGLLNRLTPAQVQQMMAELDLGTLYYNVLDSLGEDVMEELHYTHALEGVAGSELCEALFNNAWRYFQTQQEAHQTMQRLSAWAWEHGVRSALPRVSHEPSLSSFSHTGPSESSFSMWQVHDRRQRSSRISVVSPRTARTEQPGPQSTTVSYYSPLSSRRSKFSYPGSEMLGGGMSEYSPRRNQRASEFFRTSVEKKEILAEEEDIPPRPQWCHNFGAAQLQSLTRSSNTARPDRSATEARSAARKSLCEKWKVNTRPSGAVHAWKPAQVELRALPKIANGKFSQPIAPYRNIR